MSRWGDEKTLFFITCYRKHECLWDPTSLFYKSRAARANAYSSLLEQFNDDKMTVQLLKVKIKNVRTTYHQELNKIKYSKLSGAAQVYKPTLVWFDAMDSFLSETMKKEPTQMTDEPTSKQIDNFKRKLISSSKPSSQTSTVNNFEHKQVATPLNEQEPARKQIRLVAKQLMSRHEDDTDSEKSYTANRLENTSTVVSTPGLCEDEFHFFGMNVAAQLRRLPLHIALQLQTEFQNALYLARVGQTSLTAGDIEDTTMQTNEDVSDSASIDHDVDDKEFSLNIQNAIERSIGSQVSDEETVFSKAWDGTTRLG